MVTTQRPPARARARAKTGPPAERPLRRDAERNRRLILAAARELFAERGLAVTLDDIARRAGLGVGTVYRRFSSRDELIDALFEERVVELVSLADDALAAEDGWEGFVEFFRRMAELQAADRGLKEVLLRTNDGCQRVGCVRDQMRPRVEELVRRAQATGKLRSDIHATDIKLLQLMVGTIADVAPAGRPELWRRFVDLLVDGLRSSARSTLSEPPLDFDALDEVLCQRAPGRSR